MEKHPRDRESDGGADSQGAADPRVGVVGHTPDIFDEIAHNIFAKRELTVDAKWARIIAEEFRIAMADLDVSVKPKGPKPNFARTKNGKLMMLIGALENGDLWLRECRVPMIKRGDDISVAMGAAIPFDAGGFTVEVYYRWNNTARLVEFGQISAIVMDNGERYTTDHPSRAWLRHYRPMAELDMFAPMLQHTLDQHQPAEGQKWQVIGTDAEGRVYKWPDAHTPTLWKDARGREL